MFWPIHTANLNAIKAMGRSDLFLKLEIAKKLVGLIVLLSTMWFGVMVMAYSMLFTSVCSQIINAWPNKKLLNYGYLEQLKDILPGIALAVVMGVLVYLFNFLPVAEWIKLVIQIPVGMVIFILGSILFKFESFIYIKDSIKEKLTQRRHSDV